MPRFIELRAWLVKATSPVAADAIIALVTAGAFTNVLRMMFG